MIMQYKLLRLSYITLSKSYNYSFASSGVIIINIVNMIPLIVYIYCCIFFFTNELNCLPLNGSFVERVEMNTKDPSISAAAPDKST